MAFTTLYYFVAEHPGIRRFCGIKGERLDASRKFMPAAFTSITT
jgi:hypothetical protein